MVSFSRLATLALCSIGSLARVDNVIFPPKVYASSEFKVTLIQNSYTENWLDLGVLFGLYQAGHSPCEACIGTELKYFDLSRETQIGNKALRISSGAGTGQYVFVAAVPFTAAASGITGIRYFNANVEVDAKNDSNFVIQGSAQVAQGRSRSSNDDPNLSFKNENVVIASSYA